MPCYSPIKGYRAPGNSVTFTPLEGYGGPGNLVSVPCGKCLGCYMRRTADWAHRMRHEAQLHERNSFVTLTYDDEHLPRDRSLNLEHWQLFADRLRKRKGKFRYYHCGEYGPETYRPHYHACLFGVDFAKDQRRNGVSKSGHPQWESDTLTELWGLGNCTVQPFSAETAAYTAGYVTKKAERHDNYRRINTETGEVWDVKPEYSTMSRRPGIGSEWLKLYSEDIYRQDYSVDSAGRRSRPPKYYDRQLREKDPKRLEKLLRSRKLHAKSRSDEQLEISENVAYAKRNLNGSNR